VTVSEETDTLDRGKRTEISSDRFLVEDVGPKGLRIVVSIRDEALLERGIGASKMEEDDDEEAGET
jgi:hypothetical protein